MRSFLRLLGSTILFACPLAIQAQSIETKVETTTETTHTWPEGPLKFSRILAVTWHWTRVGAGEPARFHGKITRVELTTGGDGAQPVKYDSKTAPATPLPDLPIEVAGYAAWVGGELDFELDAQGGLTRLIGADTLVNSLLDRLSAPNAPIRQQVLAIAGDQFTAEGLQAQIADMLARGPLEAPGSPHRVPGFPNLVETWSENALHIAQRDPAQPSVIDLGTAKVALSLTGTGSVALGTNPSPLPFASQRTLNRSLTGAATVLEKAPTMADLPATWPVTIQITSKVTSQEAPAR